MMPMPVSEAHLHRLKRLNKLTLDHPQHEYNVPPTNPIPRSYRPKSMGYRAAVIGTFTALVLYIYCFNWALDASRSSILARSPRDRKAMSIQQIKNEGKMSVQEQLAPEFVERIRNYWLRPPSVPSNAINGTLLTSHKSSTHMRALRSFILKLVGNKTNEFFFEIGAYGGEDLSTTIALERNLNWTGVLVEPDPKFFRMLRKRRRNAWTINACVSDIPKEETVILRRGKEHRKLTARSAVSVRSGKQQGLRERFQAHCFPFLTILAAAAGADPPFLVDYLSFKRESARVRLFQSIPWDLVAIQIISVESGTGRRAILERFLRGKDYVEVTDESAGLQDLVFVHQNYWKKHMDSLAPLVSVVT